MSDEQDYRRHSDQFETAVDCGLVLAAITCIFPPLGLFVGGGMAAEHLYAKAMTRRDRKRREREAEALMQQERERHARELERIRLASLPPPPPPPDPTDDEQFAEIERRYQMNCARIALSRLDAEAKKLLLAEELRVYEDRLRELLR